MSVGAAGGSDDATTAPAGIPAVLLCMRCEYNLAGVPAEGCCPECGHRIDDSIRARGLWTFARIRRLRLITIAFVIASFAWLPMALLMASEFLAGLRAVRMVDPVIVQSCAVAAVLVHAGLLAFAAIGGTFASSRQAHQARLAIAIALSLVLVTAAGCFAAAIGGSRPLQRAFEDWGFVASGAVRTGGILLALYWITLGMRQGSFGESRRRKAASSFLRCYAMSWALFLVLIALPSIQRWLVRPPGEGYLALFLMADSIALIAIGLLVQSLILSARFREQVAGSLVGEPDRAAVAREDFAD